MTSLCSLQKEKEGTTRVSCCLLGETCRWASQRTTDLTVDRLKRVQGVITLGKCLLIWDSYRCHISDPVKKQRKQQNLYSAILPGGCTGPSQGPDVSWNKPFKLSEQYDEWLHTGEKTYTAAGNVRAIMKRVLCDMIVTAWQSRHSDLIINTLVCCGHARCFTS